MKRLYRKTLDKIMPYKPGKPIEEVRRELGITDVIKLASNENPMPPSRKVLKAISGWAKDVNRYPDGGCFYLRNKLSRKLGLSPDNIVFGNGSDEIIILTLRAFLSPGEEVIISDPTFLVYSIASTIEGASLKVVPAKGYKYDLEGMLKKITSKTKIIFIANPDNPTGSYIGKKELNSFLSRIPSGIVVFIDEAYYDYAVGRDYPETLKLIKRKDRNVIVARTFSKAYGLAGLRIGYAAARKDIITVLNKIREPFNVNLLAQKAALAAIEDDSYVKRNVRLVKKEKKRFYDIFNAEGFEYVPSRTNFILVNTEKDSIRIFNGLLKEGIVVREMSSWGLEGFIRVNVGTRKENTRFFAAFKKVLKKYDSSVVAKKNRMRKSGKGR